MVKVVDASALAALVFQESRADEVADRLAQGRLVAPALLYFEMASICRKKIALAPRQRKTMIAAYHKSLQLEIESLPVDFHALVQTAEKARLTTYDAAYLWLANTLSAQLITLDERLANAASGAARSAR